MGFTAQAGITGDLGLRGTGGREASLASERAQWVCCDLLSVESRPLGGSLCVSGPRQLQCTRAGLLPAGVSDSGESGLGRSGASAGWAAGLGPGPTFGAPLPWPSWGHGGLLASPPTRSLSATLSALGDDASGDSSDCLRV